MPNGFIADFPIYPCVRLTAGARQQNPVCAPDINCPYVWGMTWETLDSLDRVHTFYESKLNEGDWTCGGGDLGPCGGYPLTRLSGGYDFVFTRKSNPKLIGVMYVTNASGVTKIDMVVQ
jgi:hypothetical protein